MLSRISTRERVLIIVAAVLHIGGGYARFRYLPRQTTIETMAKQTQAQQAGLGTQNFPQDSEQDTAKLRAHEEQIAAALKAEDKQVEWLAGQFASRDEWTKLVKEIKSRKDDASGTAKPSETIADPTAA